MKRIISALLLVIIITMPLSACMRNEGEAVFKYENITLNEYEYRYWMSYCKARFMSTYSDYIIDSDEFWTSDLSEGRTAESFLTAQADDYIKKMIVANYLYDSVYGLKLDDTVISEIDDTIEGFIEEDAGGNKAQMNRILADYGINVDLLKQAYIHNEKLYLLEKKLIDGGGIGTPTDEMKAEYFEGNYAKAKYIFVFTTVKINYDSSGNLVYDENGSYLAALDENEAATQAAKKAELDSALTAENFGEYYDKFNEDADTAKAYPNGMYFYPTMSGISSSVVTTALTGKVGEVSSVETEYGVYYILGLEKDEKAYENSEYADFFGTFDKDIRQYEYDKMMSEYSANITVNEEAKGDITVRTVNPCWNY